MGLLSKELSTVRPTEFPVYTACQFGKQRRTNVTDFSPNTISNNVEKPGDLVSVDMILSPVGGFYSGHA